MDQVRSRASGLKVALALTCVVLLVELAGGLTSHSLALLSDAGHVLTDVFALGLAWFAASQANRPADARRSYGYHRISILAALVNSVTLIVIVLVIGYEAVRRLAHPEPIEGGIVVIAALIGIAINAFVVFGLRRETRSLNIRGLAECRLAAFAGHCSPDRVWRMGHSARDGQSADGGHSTRDRPNRGDGRDHRDRARDEHA
jgi:cation diffusion facilitator family transporter